MTQDNDKHDRSLGLTPAQVVGSAMAAMSGAFLASWLGTTGTLVGAAVGSMVATIGAAIYTHSLRRTAQAVKRTAVHARHAGLITGAVPRPDLGQASDGPVPDPNAPRPGDADPATRVTDEPGAATGRFATFFDLPWLKVTLASVAVLVAALGGITAVETVTGQPLASLLGKDDGTGTTVGHVVGSNKASTPSKQTPKEQTPATPAPTPSEAPSVEPRQPVPSTTPAPSTTPENPEPSTSQVPLPDTQP